MKQLKNIAIGTLALFALVSCEMQNELAGSSSKKTDMGLLEVGVAVKQPNAQTRAEASAAAFPVEITGIDPETADIKKTFETVAGMPASISLPVGKYTVSSHTPGTLEKRMDKPYYGGANTLIITKNLTTTTSVVCKMQNSKIQMKYNPDFLAAFRSWSITVDDGSNSVLAFDETETSPTPLYWHFDNETVTAITVNVTAVTTGGTTIRDSRTYRKEDAAENYENVSDFFGGGEGLDINMGTVTSASGKITGASIQTFITFEDASQSVEIPVDGEDNGSNDNGNEDGGETTPTESPTLQLPPNVVYSLSDESSMPATADALIKAPAGLQSILVTIDGGNQGFDEILDDLRMDGQSFKIGGINLVDNADFNGLLESVELPGAPTVGDTEYVFPIGVFFQFLNITGPTDAGKAHQFNITVTDKNGNRVSGTLKITITE